MPLPDETRSTENGQFLAQQIALMGREITDIHDKLEGKQKKDLDAAHLRIRQLQEKARWANWRAAAAGTAASGLFWIVIEMLKRFPK